MATSPESNASQEFIKQQKIKYGNRLYIEKIFDNLSLGKPDIYAVFDGMPLFAESKWMNTLSYKNTHPFGTLQINNLEMKFKCKAIGIGLLIHKDSVRYLFPDKLKPHLSKEEFLAADLFSWEKLHEIWRNLL